MADLVFSFGITNESLARYRDTAGRFAKNQEKARAYTKLALKQITFELRDQIVKNWKPHDRSGKGAENLVVEINGMQARITMSGPAKYIEHGWPPHWIVAKNAQALHWQGEPDDEHPTGDYFYKKVWNPGYRGDPFMKRAVREVDPGTRLRKLASRVFHGTDPVSESETGL